jgi:hypothetical protein
MASATDVLGDLSAHPDATVALSIGTEHFGAGLITLTLHGDGRIGVLNRSRGEERHFDLPADPARATELARELAALDLVELRAAEDPRPPGDVPIDVRVDLGGETLHHTELWHGDRWKDPRIDQLVRRFDALVEEATGGALPYGDG